MNNKQVAHLWANKSRDGAHGSHFFFEGDTIYSYGTHFPIARHHKGVVLFTTKGYSVTTAKHKGYVWSACNHLTVFHVSNPTVNPGKAAVAEYASRIKDASLAVARARDPEWQLKVLQELIAEGNAFCTHFKFKTRFSAPTSLDFEALKQKSRVEQARKAKATAAKNARIAAQNAETIQRWIAGETGVSLPWNIQTVYLRYRAKLNNDNAPDHIMETSRGATVPLADAERAFRFVMLKRQAGWKRNGEQFPIGEFHLDAVNEFGVIAGCHRVAWDEIERFAALMKWTT